MADSFSKEKRSEIMRRVKSSRNLSTELKLITFFKEYHISGWRRNFKLFGKPDFVFPKLRKLIFVDGCFWHGHNCRSTTPKTNEDYWSKKIERNKLRDILVSKTLESKRWEVIRIWECELKSKDKLASKIHFFNDKNSQV